MRRAQAIATCYMPISHKKIVDITRQNSKKVKTEKKNVTFTHV